MSTDINSLGKEALDKIDVAEEYITKVSRIATHEQKRQAAEIAQNAREKVEAAMADAKKSSSRTIRLKDQFDVSGISIPRQDEVIESEVEKLIKFIDKYSTRDEVVVIPKQEIIENPLNPALVAANARLTGELAVANKELNKLGKKFRNMSNRYDESKIKIADAEQKITELKALRNDLKREIRGKNTDIGTRNADIAALTLRINGDGTAANPGLIPQLAAEQAQVAALRAQIGVAGVNGLLNDIALKDQEIVRLNTELARVQAQLAAESAALAAERATTARLTGEIGDPTIRGSLQYKIAQLTDRFAKVRQIAVGYKERIEGPNGFQAQLQQLATEKAQLLQQKRQLEEEKKLAIDEMLKAQRSEQSAISQYDVQKDLFVSKIAVLERQVEELERKERLAQESLDRAITENGRATQSERRLSKVIYEQNTALEESRRLLQESQQRATELTARVQQLEGEQRRVTEMLAKGGAELVDLREKNRGLSEQLAQKTQDIAQKESENLQLIARLRALGAEKEQIEQQLTASRESQRRLLLQVEGLDKKVSFYEDQIRDQTTTIEQLEQDRQEIEERYRRELAQLTRERDDALAQLATNRKVPAPEPAPQDAAVYAMSDDEVLALIKQMPDPEQQMRDLKAEYEAKIQTLEETHKRFAESADEKIRRSTAENAQLIAEKEQLARDKQQLAAQVSALEQQLQTIQNQPVPEPVPEEQGRQALPPDDGKLADIEQQLAEKTREYADLQLKHKTITEELQRTKVALLAAEDALIKSQEENTGLKEQNEEQKRQIAALEKQIADIKEEIIQLYNAVVATLSPDHKKVPTDQIEKVIRDIFELVQIKQPKGSDPDAYQAMYELRQRMERSIEELYNGVKADATLSPSAEVTAKILAKLNQLLENFYDAAGFDRILPDKKVLTADDVERVLATYENKKAPEDAAVRDNLSTLLLIIQNRDSFVRSPVLTDLTSVVDVSALETLKQRLKKVATGEQASDAYLEGTLKSLDEIPKNMKSRIDAELEEFNSVLDNLMLGLSKKARAPVVLAKDLSELRVMVQERSEEYQAALDKGVTALGTIDDIYRDANVRRILGATSIDTTHEAKIRDAEQGVDAALQRQKEADDAFVAAISDEEKLPELYKKKIESLNRVNDAKKALYDAKIDMAKSFAVTIPVALDKLKKERDVAVSKHADLESSVAQLTAKVQELTASLAAETREKGQALSTVDQQIVQLRELTEKLRLTEEQRVALAGQVEGHQQNVAVERAVQLAEETARTNIAAKQKELEDAQAALAAAKAQHQADQELLDSVEDQNESMRKKSERVDALTAQVTTLTAEVAKLKAEADAAEELEKELESQLEEQTARADQLQQQLDKLAIPDLSSEMRAQAVAEADKKFVQMQAEYDVMKKRFDLLDKDAVQNVQKLEAAKQDAEREAERLRNQNARLETKEKETDQYINSINKQLEAVQTRIVDIEKEQRDLIEDHRNAIDSMNVQLRAKEAAIEAAKLEAQTQIAAANARADAAERASADLERKMTDLKEQVTNLSRINQIKSDYITSLRDFYKQMKTTAEANTVVSERKAAAKEIQTRAAGRRTELDPTRDILGKGESFWGGNPKRTGYYGGYQSYSGGDDDSLRYTAVGVAGVAGAAAWFGFSGLLIFLLVMLIVWFAYHIYSEQFVKKIHHRPRHCQAHRMIV